jgi:hypothetical protein
MPLATQSFSETYNLFRLQDMLAMIKECILRLGASKIDTFPLEKGAILQVSRRDVSMKITLQEETIGKEGVALLRGQPMVRIEIVASSGSNEALAKSMEEFKRCLFIRAARGGG